MMKLEDYENYIGTDADLATSLFEYGIIWKEFEDDIEFIYGVELDRSNGYESVYTDFCRIRIPKDTDPKEEWDSVDAAYDWDDPATLAETVCDLYILYGYAEIFSYSLLDSFKIIDEDL